MLKSLTLYRLAAACLLVFGLNGAAIAAPALWKVADDDTTVYLFGTFHILPIGLSWRSPEFDDAFAAADILWLEVDLAHDNSAGLGAFGRYGTSPDRPLKSRLSEADHTRLAQAAASIGVDISSVEKMRPWLAAMTLGLQAAQAAGYRGTGVELQLLADAAANGLEVRAFETGIEQIGFFAGMSEEAEMNLLLQTVEDLERGPELFKAMIDSWIEGDEQKMFNEINDSLKGSGPEVYERLITGRNRAWADRMPEILAEPGVHFIAVGAGHLAGPDSVQTMLSADGYTVERIPTSD